jgi:hypothetical protein
MTMQCCHVLSRGQRHARYKPATTDALQVVEIPPNAPPPLAALSGARLLILDRSGNIHSLYRPGPPGLTSSYWDLLATLPALCPDRSQPMGILGLVGVQAHMWVHCELLLR